MAEQSAQPLSVDEVVALGTKARPVRTVDICINGELASELEELELRLSALNAAAKTREDSGGEERGLSEADERDQVAAELEAKIEQAQGFTRSIVLRALPEDEWKPLFKKHADTDTGTVDLHSPLWSQLIAACAEEPKMTVDAVNRLRHSLAESQYERIRAGAYYVNTLGGVDVPKSSPALRALKREQPA